MSNDSGALGTVPKNANFLPTWVPTWVSTAPNFLAKLLAAATFVLIIAGGLVTSTGSGLSVPDWPLSYGTWMPPMVGGIRYEHTHRMIGALVGLMTLVLALWLAFTEQRRWVRWLGIAALGLVVAQGILGGLTVLYLLPAPVSILHACLAQTFFALVVGLVYVTAPHRRSNERQVARVQSFSKKSLLMTTVLIYLQLILGATIRHTHNHFLVIPHVVVGLLILGHAVVILIRCVSDDSAERKLIFFAAFLTLLAIAQMVLGMGSFAVRMALGPSVSETMAGVLLVTSHQTLGALLLATAVFLTLREWRTGGVV